MVDSFEVRNVDWIVTHISQKYTRNIGDHCFSGFDITGSFSQFSGTFPVHLQHTCFEEIIVHSFITANCFFTGKSTCDQYFVEQTQIRSDTSGCQQSATCT